MNHVADICITELMAWVDVYALLGMCVCVCICTYVLHHVYYIALVLKTANGWK